MATSTFNPRQWATPQSQEDIVKAKHAGGPFRQKQTEMKTPGLDQVVENITQDPTLFKIAIYNAMRVAPILRTIEFSYGNFTGEELAVQKDKIPNITQESKESIAATFASELARDQSIINIKLTADDELTVSRLLGKGRLDEGIVDKADPKFKIEYSTIA